MGLKKVKTVSSQDEPNGDFPTVDSPNPENPEALAQAVSLMQNEGLDLALGTDPDTDRVGMACMHQGNPHYLSGNQIGTLLLHYILTELKNKKSIPTHPYFLKSIVTTSLQEKIARHFGLHVENTLTGFKWIGQRMEEIAKDKPDWNFLFASEESFGYLHHPFVRDKDAVSSMALICEMALTWKLAGKTLIEALDHIYETFGFFHESLLNLVYTGKKGTEKISRIMAHFRDSRQDKLFDKTY